MHTRWRWLSPALVALYLAFGFAGTARAAWTMEPVKWKRWVPYTTAATYGFGGNIFTSDTLWVSGTLSNVDTTAAWSMLDADVMNLADVGRVAIDSTVAATFILSADSTVASAIAFKGTTVKFQVNYGVNNGGWNDLTTAYGGLPTDAIKHMLIPLYANSAVATGDLGIDYGIPGSVFAPAVRAIVTWGGAGTACPMARCWVRKYIRNSNVNRDAQPYAPLNY